MGARTVHGSRWILGAILFLVSCGGDDGGGGRTSLRGIAGSWTFPCTQHDVQEWRAETLQLDPQTSVVRHSGIAYATPDCSDAGQILVEEQGTYSIGDTIDCMNGIDSSCTELDIAWSGGDADYGVFSVDESGDPDRLLVSHLKGSPSLRPLDVDPSMELRRMSFPDQYGHAILDIYLVDGGYDGSPPQPLSGYELLPTDLNEGSGGHYIWLYYRMGRANGADGTPLGLIYTVDEHDGEHPVRGDVKLPVNLNAGPIVGHELWLYKRPATSRLLRSIVVTNPTDGYAVYGPVGSQGQYDVVWVQERIPDSLKCPWPEYPLDVQDLNEGEGLWTDYIYIGYGLD